MKDILLRPQAPYFNHMEVDILDFPKGTDEEPRWRMKVDIEYSEFDVDQLKKRGLDLDGAMDYYNDWLYKLIRARLLDEWKAVGGLEETMDIVKEHIKGFYEAKVE